MPYGDQKPHHKASGIVLAAVLVLSASGYFMGMRQTASHVNATANAPVEPLPETAAQEADPAAPAPAARQYSDMAELPKKNARWENAMKQLAAAPDNLFTAVTNSEEQRLQIEKLRASRRAFDGAPPVVPHPIDQTSAANCLACHGDGKVVKGKVASKISHAIYENCTQCHVPLEGTSLLVGTWFNEKLAETSFAGIATPSKGARAFDGAPPAIPHPTLMRSDCMSCHGPNGTAGIRTTHAYRQSCTQCHAPNAALDQRFLLSSDERPPAVTLPPMGGLQ